MGAIRKIGEAQLVSGPRVRGRGGMLHHLDLKGEWEVVEQPL
jgi:hypothetical protein